MVTKEAQTFATVALFGFKLNKYYFAFVRSQTIFCSLHIMILYSLSRTRKKNIAINNK